MYPAYNLNEGNAMEGLELNALKISGNSYRPEVDFNPQTGDLIISGRSILENSPKFYDPIMDWFKAYAHHPAEKTRFHIKLDYFNTSSSKSLLSIIEILDEMHQSGKHIEILWYYSDEDMEELGEDYSHMIDIPFSFLKLN